MGLFSRSRLRGTHGARLHTTVQVWAPGGFLGACSRCSKSRNLASNRRIAFRPAGANQAHANPKNVRKKKEKEKPCCCFCVPQQMRKARQPRYNSRAISFSLTATNGTCACRFVSVRGCVCAIAGSCSSRNQEQSRGQSCHSTFLARFHFCHTLCCCCVPG